MAKITAKETSKIYEYDVEGKTFARSIEIPKGEDVYNIIYDIEETLDLQYELQEKLELINSKIELFKKNYKLTLVDKK